MANDCSRIGATKHTRWLLAFLLAPLTAAACQFERTQEEVFARAKSVFRARVVEVRLTQFVNPANPGDQADIVEGKFEVEEVYKGTPPASGVVRVRVRPRRARLRATSVSVHRVL